MSHANMDKLARRCADLLGDGERLLATARVTPRGSVHEMILGGAGTVAGSTIGPALAGVGAVAGSRAGAAHGREGRRERQAAGVDVGRATQVLLAVTDRRILLLGLSALGRPRRVEAELELDRIGSVRMGETRLYGQKMAEIVITTNDGHEVGLGVARVHRRAGEAVVEALSG